LSVFLRGQGVDVLAPDAADEAFAHARKAWLLPPGPLSRHAEDDGEIATVWTLVGDGATQGSVALAHVDWIARRAQIVATLLPTAPSEAALEALTLVVRYAGDELALDRLEARVRADDAATARALAGLGFREEGRLAGGWRDGAPVDVVLWARVVPQGPA
jgi:RimJ/RimL family protein N-acetyltransferase